MLARGRKFRLCSLRSVKEGEIEMKETNVTFLKAVQRSFFMVLFLILFLSSNSLAGTFMFEPATHQITCYDGSGNVITCPPGGNPFIKGDSCYDGSGNLITCPLGGNVTKGGRQVKVKKLEDRLTIRRRADRGIASGILHSWSVGRSAHASELCHFFSINPQLFQLEVSLASSVCI